MGRRKIEIQPITNERNRSVTFLKRKNGLFKKAHELGVLCSVEVAVIIFDDRHGHESKLFQYSSSDVRDIVQRHLRHNGERDTRGPADFSGEGAGAKNGAAGDGDDDDDEGEAEESAPPPPPPAKGTSSASKQNSKDDDEFQPSPRVITEAEPKNRASVSNERSAPERRTSAPLSTFPPFPQYEHLHPVSSDRLHPRPYQEQPQSKKPRLDYPLDMGIPRSQGHPLSAASDDSMHRHESLYMYPPHAPPFRRPSEAGHNHPSPYGPYGVPYPASPPPGHHSGYGGPPFHSPPPEFAIGPHISSWGRTHPSNSNGAHSGSGGLSAFFSPGTHMPPGFDGLPFPRADEGREGDKPRDTFAHTFLEADQQQRKVALPQGGMPVPSSRGSTSAASFGIDWPSHRPPPALPPSGAPPTPPPKSAEAPPEENGAASTSDAATPGWLDLLSEPGGAAQTETKIPTPRSASAAPSASGS